MKILTKLVFILFISILGCDSEQDKLGGFEYKLNTDKYESMEKLTYTLVDADTVPPCYFNFNGEIVFKNNNDYRFYLGRYGQRGEDEFFIADGIKNEFALSYSPADKNANGKIEISDISIFYNDEIVITYNNQDYIINTTPLYIDNDNNIIVYSNENPNIEIARIESDKVLTFNPTNSSVTFIKTPPEGVEIALSANRVFDTIEGVSCSMANFKFNNKMLIGKSASGGDCLQGFDIELYKDSASNTIIYSYTLIEDYSTGCPEVPVSFIKWIQLENIDHSYNIIFEENPKRSYN